MAVVIVGDFPDCEKVVELINRHMGAAFPPPQGGSSNIQQQQQEQQQLVVLHPPLPVVEPSSWQHTEPR
jgi:hypothetical protein